jgi:bacteriocin-like protein
VLRHEAANASLPTREEVMRVQSDEVMRELSDEEMKQVSGGREGTGLANSYGTQGLAPANGVRVPLEGRGGTIILSPGPGLGNGHPITVNP